MSTPSNAAAEHMHAGRGEKPWRALSLADRTTPLGAEDVELLGTSAYMLGRA